MDGWMDKKHIQSKRSDACLLGWTVVVVDDGRVNDNSYYYKSNNTVDYNEDDGDDFYSN